MPRTVAGTALPRLQDVRNSLRFSPADAGTGSVPAGFPHRPPRSRGDVSAYFIRDQKNTQRAELCKPCRTLPRTEIDNRKTTRIS